jgi:cell division protein FtsW
VEEARSDTMMVSHRYDRWLLAIVLCLMGIGIVMVYSASVVSAEIQFGDDLYYLKRQLAFMGVGLTIMVAAMNFPYQMLERYARPLMLIAVFLLCLALIPGISSSAKGASRWLNLGVIRLQPSEVVKLSFIIYLSAYLSQRQHELHKFKVAWVPNILLVGFIAALLMVQPDFGSTVIIGGMLTLMIWAAGGSHLHVVLLGLCSLGLGAAAIAHKAYRMKRLMAFMSPESDPQGAAYQINQALISFGSGEWTGLGLGASRQKLLYLPDAHTDFIFSIIGEETGLLGASAIVILFVLFLWRGLTIARRASHSFGALLAFGLTAMIAGQACVNMAVVMAMLPTKGLTLPFISYGGSSLLVLSLSAGILLNISRQMPPPDWFHKKQVGNRALKAIDALFQKIAPQT